MKKKYIPAICDLVEVSCPFFNNTTIGIITSIKISNLTKKFVSINEKELVRSLGYENLIYEILITNNSSFKIMKAYKGNKSSTVDFYYDDFKLIQKLN